MSAISSSTPLISLVAVSLDTETTGLDTKVARIVQLGAVRIVRGALNDADIYDRLVNPGIPIPAASSAIHHLTDADVSSAPAFPDVAASLLEFCKDNVIVGHSIGFDITILGNEFERAGLAWTLPRTLDTLLLTQIAAPELPDYTLDTIASWLGIPVRDRHTAIGDALMTAEIFVSLLPKLRTNGIRTLAEAENACRVQVDRTAPTTESGWVPAVRAIDTLPLDKRALARIDSFPYSHRVRDVMSAPPLFLEPSCTLAEASGILTAKASSSAFVRTSEPGIITERDLMRALAKDDNARQRTVREIMSGPLICVDDDAFVYRALATMTRANIRHLAVRDATGDIVGALTTGNLLRQRAQGALVMGDEIDHADNTAELGEVWSRLPGIARNMLAERIGVRQITAVVSEELTALTRRAAQLSERDMLAEGKGSAPADYCLLILGSAGRGESLLAPDQDNAIIYRAPERDDEEGVDEWFAELGARLAQILDDVGVPFCKGGVMAKNAAWRHSLSGWKSHVARWTDRFSPEDILNVDIFYDFRPALGDIALADDLWNFAYERGHNSPGFLRSLGASGAGIESAIGMFGTFRTRQGRVDLKKGGLMALVSAARVLALRHDVRLRSTLDRLTAIRELDVLNRGDIDTLIAAHEITLNEILRQQLEDIDDGVRLSNKVKVSRLTKHERSELRWALQESGIIRTILGDPMAFG